MSEEDKLPFLSRWSRRKLDAKEEAPAVAQADAVAVPGDGEVLAQASSEGVEPEAPPAPLPAIDSLHGVASEYKAFLQPGVDETLKRAALKKLFSDPHFSFASMDKLDIYIDDYSIEDPIPEAMLRLLNQSKSLFLFDEKKEPDAEIGAAVSPAEAHAEPARLAVADADAPGPPDAQAPVTVTPAPKKTEPPTPA
jgi:hypothetical protein